MITPSQIREKKISTVSSDGYDRNEVNELLVEILESYEAVCAENKELYRKMEILANRIEEYRADEDSIKTALISAQKMAHQVTAEAKEKAEQTLSESAASAQQTVQDAKEKADKIVGEAREYVATLTKEKAEAADEIIADAKEKANTAITSAKIVAQDTIDKAKQLTDEIVTKARSEREHQQKVVDKLKNESRDFKLTLVSLYETQLNKLKEIAQSNYEGEGGLNELENELEIIISHIDEVSNTGIIPEMAEKTQEPEPVAEEEEAEPYEEEAEAQEEILEEEISVTEEESQEEITAEEESEFELREENDEIEEIIDEIEASIPDFEPIEEKEEEPQPPTEEEVASALNAFTDNNITPVEDSESSIPVIEEEPELENAMPFESFFNVDKSSANTSETISLTAPDEDDDDDDTSKFKGFFKKRK